MSTIEAEDDEREKAKIEEASKKNETSCNGMRIEEDIGGKHPREAPTEI